MTTLEHNNLLHSLTVNVLAPSSDGEASNYWERARRQICAHYVPEVHGLHVSSTIKKFTIKRETYLLLGFCFQDKEYSPLGYLWELGTRTEVAVRIMNTEVGSFDFVEPWNGHQRACYLPPFSPTSHLSRSQQLHFIGFGAMQDLLT